jgi:glycolate oxidase iron-sulfur subunit
MNDKMTDIIQDLNRCSRCGGCQAVCPLFQETKAEPLVARGKIFLLKNYLEGNIELSPKMKELFSLCLLCKACVDQCPNKIPVDRIVIRVRQEIAKEKGISFIKKNVFQNLLQNNGQLSTAAKIGYLYHHCGLQWLARKSHVLDLMGHDLAKKESLLPDMTEIPFRRQVPRFLTCNQPKLRVAYFTGCMTNYIYPKTGHAVLNVMRHQNVEIVIPEQWCCGIPALASGDEGSAVELARKNIETFRKARVDAIISDCASCGAMLKEFGNLVGTAEARELSEKSLDFSTFLDQVIDYQAGEGEVRATVTYHDPCHLRRGQGVWEAPRRLLKTVPGLEYREMKDADRCCGAAGSFNMTYYELSTKIGQKKARNIIDSGADAVVTGCPSCIMQLSHNLQLAGSSVRVLHLAELLSQTFEPVQTMKATLVG